MRAIGKSRWRLVDVFAPGLLRAIDPSGNRKLLHKVKLRRGKLRPNDKRCKGCGEPLPSGTMAWSPLADNGLHRSDRFCDDCVGENTMNEVDWTQILEAIDDAVDRPMSQSDAKSNLQALADELRIRIDGLKGDLGEDTDDDEGGEG